MALYVPLLLFGVAVALMAVSHILAQRKARKQARTPKAPATRILIHAINDDRCTGCDACVAVCPTDVLDLVDNKSRVLRFSQCIQCEQCMWACPTRALVMHYEDEEPPPIRVPSLDPYYQTDVPGQYLIGEVAGKPLVKNAANAGRAVVEHMLREGLRPGAFGRRRAEGSDPSGAKAVVDVAIVGSGPGGLSAALTCIHHGLSYVVLEKEQLVASTIARYPKGKDVMAEPYDTRNVSFLPVFDSTKEELLPIWHELIERVGLDIRRGEAVETVERDASGLFEVRTTVARYRAQRVVLATGLRGKPRTLGVPGENLPKVASLLEDPDRHAGQDVLVVGGGDSALEAACALADAGARVTLSYRGKSFHRAQAKNKQRIQEYGQSGKVTVLYGSQVTSFSPDAVDLKLGDGRVTRLANQAAFVLIGADPPIAWLEKLGIRYVERPHWYALGKTDQLVESLTGTLRETPRTAREAADIVLRRVSAQPDPSYRPPVPEPSVIAPLPRRPLERPATVPGQPLDWSEVSVFTSAPRRSPEPSEPSPDRPLSLEEFARRKARQRKPRTEEVTRILRALRDEGARLAHDDTGVEIAAAPSGGFVASVTAESSIELSGADIVHEEPKVIVDADAARPGRARDERASSSRSGFIEARTTAADPEMLLALRERAARSRPPEPTSAPPARDDDTVQTVISIDSVDVEELADEAVGGWEEPTAFAEEEVVSRLRDRSRR